MQRNTVNVRDYTYLSILCRFRVGKISHVIKTFSDLAIKFNNSLYLYIAVGIKINQIALILVTIRMNETIVEYEEIRRYTTGNKKSYDSVVQMHLLDPTMHRAHAITLAVVEPTL